MTPQRAELTCLQPRGQSRVHVCKIQFVFYKITINDGTWESAQITEEIQTNWTNTSEKENRNGGWGGIMTLVVHGGQCNNGAVRCAGNKNSM